MSLLAHVAKRKLGSDLRDSLPEVLDGATGATVEDKELRMDVRIGLRSDR